ncbi:MAG: hypothetical protein J7K36_07605 [Archaeoglobaceae archaeon]|nr:hypothetical protein [Archaeoglobaceae archaeon]
MDEIGNVREMGTELLSLSRKFNEKLNSIENKVNNLFENYKSQQIWHFQFRDIN